MEIHAGDCFTVPIDGVEVTVQAVCARDGGKTWHCCRTDRSLAEAAVLIPTEELLESLMVTG